MTRTIRPWPFWLYAAVSAVHVGAMVLGAEAFVYPTKLLLMPLLAFAAIWTLRDTRWKTAATLLVGALGFSWLGDGASLFFPFLADELPAMLACFGVAHLLYIWLFARHLRVRRTPGWALIYAVWWVATLAFLWPHLGALAIAVAVYGLVLGGTAALSTRGGQLTALGGALFLASDTILAMRLFLPAEMSAAIAGSWVMLTYTTGQGLLVYGAADMLRRAHSPPATMDAMTSSVRVDSWLWAVRVYKTRSAATTACRAGHVRVNGERVKAAHAVRIGDELRVRIAGFDRILIVRQLLTKRVGAPLAAEALDDHTPAREPVAMVAVRDRGAGRPTKRERRDIDRLRGRD